MKKIKYFLTKIFSIICILISLVFFTNPSSGQNSEKKGIPIEEIFPAQSIDSMNEIQKITWMPISSEYINQHKSNPPDERLLPSFLSFVYSTIKKEWIPEEFEKKLFIY